MTDAADGIRTPPAHAYDAEVPPPAGTAGGDARRRGAEARRYVVDADRLLAA